MPNYLFDVKLDAAIRIDAATEAEAREALRNVQAESANLGIILGQVIVCEVSINDEPDLAEVDGEDAY